MGAHARGIGTARTWPCVGDPDTWDHAGTWQNCPADGVLALTTVGVTDEHPEGVVLLLTACRDHVGTVREWLRPRALEPIDTWGTEILLSRMGQIDTMLENTPLVGLSTLAG